MRTRWPGDRPIPRLAARDAAVTCAAVLAAAALAGCGSLAPSGAAAPGASAGGALSSGGAGSVGAGSGGAGSGGAGGDGGVAGSSSGSAQPGAACAPAALRIRLDTAAAGVAAGTYYVPLEFTNTSSRACELTGYPAVALTSGVTGRQIGTEAAVDRSVKATAVLLQPGGIAHAWLGIADVANFPAKTCRPITAAGFRVVVPGSESASYLAHPVPACKEPARDGGILVVRPVQPGAARRGTA
ncbi:MAG TPA: DUF4232 domain-containing protein [Streptosporangiaceae bacterium]|nr:DUF4232 domain-containing protein [Streptosporangiaceae bacterium]